MKVVITNKKNKDVPKSGCGSLTLEQVDAVVKSMYEDDEDVTRTEYIFSRGFVAGLMFAFVPEGEEMHGRTAREFMDNSLSYVFESLFMEEIEDVIGKIAESLGIDADAVLVMGDDD